MFPFRYHGLQCLVCCWVWFCQFVLVDSTIWLPYLLDLFLLILEHVHTKVFCHYYYYYYYYIMEWTCIIPSAHCVCYRFWQTSTLACVWGIEGHYTLFILLSYTNRWFLWCGNRIWYIALQTGTSLQMCILAWRKTHLWLDFNFYFKRFRYGVFLEGTTNHKPDLRAYAMNKFEVVPINVESKFTSSLFWFIASPGNKHIVYCFGWFAVQKQRRKWCYQCVKCTCVWSNVFVGARSEYQGR
jgi:hypothetical protein